MNKFGRIEKTFIQASQKKYFFFITSNLFCSFFFCTHFFICPKNLCYSLVLATKVFSCIDGFFNTHWNKSTRERNEKLWSYEEFKLNKKSKMSKLKKNCKSFFKTYVMISLHLMDVQPKTELNMLYRVKKYTKQFFFQLVF